MNLKNYLLLKQERENQKHSYRNICEQCRQPEFSCYCQFIQKFDPKIKFVILMHPIERRRRIATGRMSHLSLHDSELIVGQSFADDRRLNIILKNPEYNCVVLYPGKQSIDISRSAPEMKQSLFVEGKKTVVIVIDGTWATAKKMMNQSPNLNELRRICFVPPGPSRFRVRKQPRAECYSTIEAVHHTIELLAEVSGFDLVTAEHKGLLNVFDKMVERQLKFMQEAFDNPATTSYRRYVRRAAG